MTFPLKNIIYPGVLISSDQPNVQFYYDISNRFFRKHTKWIFLFNVTSLILPLNLIQMYLKFLIIPILIFYLQIYFHFILLFLCFLISLSLFRGRSFSFNLFMYHSPPIACNKFLQNFL